MLTPDFEPYNVPYVSSEEYKLSYQRIIEIADTPDAEIMKITAPAAVAEFIEGAPQAMRDIGFRGAATLHARNTKRLLSETATNQMDAYTSHVIDDHRMLCLGASYRGLVAEIVYRGDEPETGGHKMVSLSAIFGPPPKELPYGAPPKSARFRFVGARLMHKAVTDESVFYVDGMRVSYPFHPFFKEPHYLQHYARSMRIIANALLVIAQPEV